MRDDYDHADDSRKSYDLAIAAMGEKLRSFRREQISGHDVCVYNDRDVVSIYGVRASGSDAFVYVGSTSQPIKARIRAHVLSARYGSPLPFHLWLKDNVKIDVRVLERTTEAERELRERHWINFHAGALLNITDGGPGLSGHKFAGTDHARRIGAAIATGATFHCERCGDVFYRKVSAIQRGHNKYCSRFCANARRRRPHNVAA